MLKRFLCCLLILFCLTAALAQTPTAPCDCCAKKPDYTNSTYNTSTTSPPPYPWSLFTGQIAIVTQKHPADGGPLLDRVLVIWNLTNQSGAESNLLFDRWWNPTSSPPTHYYSDSRWNYTNLGDVFGLTLDNLGNVYVAATNIYGTGAVGFLSPGSTNAQKSGQIYKIDASGQPTPFGPIPLHLPLQNDSNGLGNIAWDCGHDSLFASNFNDGLIYRLNSAGILNPATWDHGANLPSAVDIHGVPLGRTAIPLGAKDVPSSYAALGRRPWAVRAYKNRLYYSIWSQDSGRTAGAGPNEIWSVALDISGNPVTPARLEITLPVLDSATFNYSNPVSDISFSAGGACLSPNEPWWAICFPAVS